VPLIRRPGEAQADFGHALVKMSGVLRKICFFVILSVEKSLKKQSEGLNFNDKFCILLEMKFGVVANQGYTNVIWEILSGIFFRYK